MRVTEGEGIGVREEREEMGEEAGRKGEECVLGGLGRREHYGWI